VSTGAIILVVVLGVLALLAIGGFIANRRRAKATRPHFIEQLEIANRDLAAAHAADKGWEPQRLHEAAREAFTEQRAGAVTALELLQVIDPPGTEQDKAVFLVETDNGTFKLTMGRSGDDWVFESVG
jgi:hypothetical protein